MHKIEFNNVTKRFDKYIIKNLNLSINSHRTALVGISGVGKTTILKMILGIDKHYEGEITNEYKNTSVSFQHNILPLYLSIYDVCKARKLNIKKLDQLLSSFFVKEYKFFLMKDLSKRSQTKMNIIFTLISESEILFFDEPTNFLDFQSVLVLKNILFEEKRDIFIISHDSFLVDNLINNILVFDSVHYTIKPMEHLEMSLSIRQLLNEISVKNLENTN